MPTLFVFDSFKKIEVVFEYPRIVVVTIATFFRKKGPTDNSSI